MKSNFPVRRIWQVNQPDYSGEVTVDLSEGGEALLVMRRDFVVEVAAVSPGEFAILTAFSQGVAFGTSGHRGSAANGTFNEDHILAITQAIVEYRAEQGVDGPLYIGMDSHALSLPAQQTALEVLAAHGVELSVEARPNWYFLGQ